MSVYYGKMRNPEECKNFICRGSKRYFGNIQPGDYVFIRLATEGPRVNRLWKLKYIDPVDHVTAHFDEIFQFSTLSVDQFTRLTLFRIGIAFGNYVWKPRSSVGFYRIELDDQNIFDSVTKNQQSFNQFISNKDNYRKIVFVDNIPDKHSDVDIQIYNNGNKFDIFNKSQPFLSKLYENFNPDRYQEYKDFLNNPLAKDQGARKKVKNWLEQHGRTEEISIQNLWDFFCSKETIKPSKKSLKPTINPSIDLPKKDKIKNSNYKNLIIYGIPGCGKSYRLKTEYLAAFDKIYYTTFYPDYSNADFVGQVRPIKNGKNINYNVIPGPFTEALLFALKNKDKNVALVIEEINRGNAAAIFGDIFQLLDRNGNGDSAYSINNEIISSYLNDNGIQDKNIRIPSNLYIYATMNTSDQNVFKLDTAFKRRWEFERLTNNDTADDVKDFAVFKINGVDISWKKFIEKINKTISSNDNISGDRQIGNFFYEGDDNNLERFANKVLEYLYNDVCKYNGKEDIFNIEKYKTFDEIYDAFKNGENVFNESLFREDNDAGDETNKDL